MKCEFSNFSLSFFFNIVKKAVSDTYCSWVFNIWPNSHLLVTSSFLNINFLLVAFLFVGRKRKWFPIDEAIRHLDNFKPVQCSYVKLLKKEDKVPWYTFFTIKYVIWSNRGLWYIIFLSVREGKFKLYAYHSFRFLIDLNISGHSNWNMTHMHCIH